MALPAIRGAGVTGRPTCGGMVVVPQIRGDGSSDEIGSCGLLRPESAAILNVPVPVGLIGFNVSRLARFLCDNPRAADPNSIGFDAFDETEIPVHAERRF